MEAFEYAIKKDVRNNPIVREIDEARQRDLWKSMAGAALLVLVMVFWAWQHFELVQHGYLMERLQQERAAEEELNRQLRLEIAVLRAPRRIEDMAHYQTLAWAQSIGHDVMLRRIRSKELPVKEFDRGTFLDWMDELNRDEHVAIGAPDARTWTFHLVKNARFHNGDPVTAEAVRWSFARTLKLNQGPAWMLSDFLKEDGIKVVNEHTIQFTSASPMRRSCRSCRGGT